MVSAAKKPNRNFVSTLQLILAPKLRQLESEKAPEVVLGEVTPRMRELQKQVARGRKIAERAEKALEQMHVSVSQSCGCELPELSVDYRRDRELKTKWREQQDKRLERFNKIKAAAMVDLLDMDPAKAQGYLRNVRQSIESL